MWEVVMYQSRFNLMEEPILAGVVGSNFFSQFSGQDFAGFCGFWTSASWLVNVPPPNVSPPEIRPY